MNVHVARMTTTALGAVCGVLLLGALLQYAGVGRGYHWAPDDPAAAPQLPGAGVEDKPLRLPPASAFAEIDARPLFNEDRKPTPADASEGDGEAPPQVALNVSLTGIIATSSVRIAMVHDKARNKSMALKVGMPLEGDQASWTLVEVKPRSVVFRNAANERTELELETSLVQTKPAARSGAPVRGGAAARDNRRMPPGDLAKRIEERRRQMREDAEKLRQRGGRPNTPPRPAPPKK